MKNLKYMSLMLALACVFTLGFTSCSDDDDDDTPAPTVVMDEANIEEGFICVKADVTAPGRTAAILITVTDATGKTTKATKAVTDTKYIGVQNIPGFHVHVDIDGKGVVAGRLFPEWNIPDRTKTNPKHRPGRRSLHSSPRLSTQ